MPYKNVLNNGTSNALIQPREDYGMLPMRNEYGQYQVGGALGGHAGFLDQALEFTPWGDKRAMERAHEASTPTITPDLMGGATVGIKDTYPAAFETATAMPAAGDAATLFKMGAMSLPGILAMMSRKTDDVLTFTGATCVKK